MTKKILEELDKLTDKIFSYKPEKKRKKKKEVKTGEDKERPFPANIKDNEP